MIVDVIKQIKESMTIKKTKYFFILNPSSKGGKSKKLIERLFHLLKNTDIEYQYAFTSNLNDA
ncbi:MAG: hypothetical protein KAR38_03145, partial [Calditrichia bacterium]|nr:hypothetical protein [Calditrichia bacterium]